MRLKLELLLLDVLNVMRQFDVFVFVEELALPVFFVATPQRRLILEVLGLEVFAKLRDLPCQRLYHLLLALDDVVELNLLGDGLVDLALLALHLQLYLLLLFEQVLRLEFEAFHLTLVLADLVLQHFSLLLALQELLVFVDTNSVALPTHLIRLLSQVVCLATSLIKITTQLLDEIAVPPIIHTSLQRLILEHELLHFGFVAVAHIVHLFLALVPLRLQLSPADVKLALCLVELVLQSFILLDAQLEIGTVACLKVLLYLHAENVSIDGQLDLLR